MKGKDFTLKDMAEAGYIMGLHTIGEVANHMALHYDAYWPIEELNEHIVRQHHMIVGREDDSIHLYLTDEDRKAMDDELEKAMAEGPQPFSVKEPPMT